MENNNFVYPVCINKLYNLTSKLEFAKSFINSLRLREYDQIQLQLSYFNCKDINELVMMYYRNNKIACVKYIINCKLITFDLMKFYQVVCDNNHNELIAFIINYAKYYGNNNFNIEIAIKYSIDTKNLNVEMFFLCYYFIEYKSILDAKKVNPKSNIKFDKELMSVCVDELMNMNELNEIITNYY
jgi:hypothetical protein